MQSSIRITGMKHEFMSDIIDRCYVKYLQVSALLLKQAVEERNVAILLQASIAENTSEPFTAIH